MKLINILIVSLLILTSSHTANAQFANSKKKGKDLMVAVGGGVSVADAGSYSLMGGNLTFELRKPIVLFAQNYSLSVNLLGSAIMGNASQTGQDSKFDFIPTGIISLNLNAYSQATKVAKNTFGGFLGVGLMIMPSKTIDKRNLDGTYSSIKTGVMGPVFLFGPRFRVGKSFLDLRVYGGTAFGGDTEMVNAGLNLMFTFGMGKTKRHGMQ